MKIGVNAKFLTKPYTGIAQYTRNLFAHLAKIDKKNRYILVVPEKVDGMKFPKNISIKILPENHIGSAGMRKTWWEQVTVPKYFKKNKFEVAFFPYPCNPWANDWKKNKIKTIVTVHDCIPWMLKEYRKGFLSRMYHYQTKKAVKNADIVFTVSKASKEDIVKVCGVNNKKVHVVYNDADDIFKKPISEKLNLKKHGFFLYVGGYDVRKNVKYLVDEYDSKLPLVLAGGALFKNKLYSSIDVSKKQNIIKTGFLTEEKLAAMYRNCYAFINLSSYEGFNIPIIEAANCGAPLILSDIPVHREIAGNFAMYVNINHKSSLSAALEKIANPKIREKYCAKSLKLAKKYSWETSAHYVKDVLFSK